MDSHALHKCSNRSSSQVSKDIQLHVYFLKIVSYSDYLPMTKGISPHLDASHDIL